MSVGSIPTFFNSGKMFMTLRCIRCKIKNNVCINVMLEKKQPPVCGKCKKNLIEQEDVDEICASIHPDELKPDPIPDLPPDPLGPSGPDPNEFDVEDVTPEEEDWIL